MKKDNYSLNDMYQIRYFYNYKSMKSLLKDMWIWLREEAIEPHRVIADESFDPDTSNIIWEGHIIYINSGVNV